MSALGTASVPSLPPGSLPRFLTTLPGLLILMHLFFQKYDLYFHAVIFFEFFLHLHGWVRAFSSYSVHGLLFVVVRGFQGARVSVVVAHGFSCSKARGIFLS